MCYQRDDQGHPRHAGDGELTPAQWKDIIDQVAGFASSIYWIGGEVMIYPRIVELFAYARAKGLQVSLSTNGFALAEVAEQLVAMGVQRVVVSLDGPREIHNRIRRHPKAYDWAVKGVKALLKARRARGSHLPNVTVGLTITLENYTYVIGFYALAQTLEVDVAQYIGLIYLSPATIQCHRQVMQTEFDLRPKGMHVLCAPEAPGLDALYVQREINHLCASAPARPALEFWPAGLQNHLQAHYGPDENLPLPNQHCRSISNNLVIQPNGDVTACPFLLEVVVGNALEQDLPAIWNSPLYKQFRKRVRSALLPGCARCTWADYRGAQAVPD